MFTRTRAAALASLLSACGPDLASVDDGADELLEAEGALCARTDVGGLAEGTPEARAVLAVANSLSAAQLRTEVRLTATAARNIAARRDGPDARPGTADDRPFASLADLSGVCQVGNVAMKALAAFARAKGYVATQQGAELPLPACQGDLTPLELQGLFNQAWQNVRLERWTRACQEVNGQKSCEAWARGPVDSAPKVYGSIPLAEQSVFALRVGAANGVAQVTLKNERSSSYWGEVTVGEARGGQTLAGLTLSYRGFNDVCDDFGWNTFTCLRSHYDYFDAKWLTMQGTISERCLSVADEVQASQEVSFGPGVRSFVESVRTFSTVQ